MIIITGAAGSIGGAFIDKLHKEGYHDLVLVDNFPDEEIKSDNEQVRSSLRLEPKDLFDFIRANHHHIQFVFHFGIRTDDASGSNDIDYSKSVWNACVEFGLPLVYTSSVATYGLGERGYKDSEEKLELLNPIDPKGISNHAFDVWAINQVRKPYFWVCLKIFDLYGPNEEDLGDAASFIYRAYRQIEEFGYIELYKSHKSDFLDGEQARDYIYIKDLQEVLYFFMHNRKKSGVFNVGSGEARSFNDLSRAVFRSCDKQEDIRYVEQSESMRGNFQYFQQAPVSKLREAGFDLKFYTLEDGIDDYIREYLAAQRRL